MARYAADGVTFEFPDGWELSREEVAPNITVNLQVGRTAFWSLTLIAEAPPAVEVLQAAIEAYQSEYDSVDVYEDIEDLAGLPSANCELDFVYLDLVNSVNLRAEVAGDYTVLVVYQAEDRELDGLRPAFEAVTASVRYAGDLQKTLRQDLFHTIEHDHDHSHDHDHDHDGPCSHGHDHDHH